MESFKQKIAGLCVFNVKSDPVLEAFSMLGGKSRTKSYDGYSRLCSALLLSGKSLGEYLHDMLIFSDSPLISACARENSELRTKAVECDLEVMRSIASYSSSALKRELAKLYGDEGFNSLPDFEEGGFDYGAQYFIDFAAKHGSGVFAQYKAFTFDNGELHPIENIDPIRLTDLKNYSAQRKQVVENTICFLNDEPAQNVLLYGDRGTGKSSTVKAILNEYDALRMVEVAKNDIAGLPALFRRLKDIPLHFIVTIDDLTFAENDDRFGILKAVLEGSLSARPDNILIYATTNRRKIIKESAAEREISGADAIDESMSLADRFGLFITFIKPDKAGFLDIVRQLAEDRDIDIGEEKLFAAAERFALKRGGRSPRIARQFIDWLKGRLALGMDY